MGEMTKIFFSGKLVSDCLAVLIPYSLTCGAAAEDFAATLWALYGTIPPKVVERRPSSHG